MISTVIIAQLTSEEQEGEKNKYITIWMVLSRESTQKLRMLRPFKTVFIGLLVLIKNKLVDPNKAYIFHQTLLSLGLIVPHGHVWWQEGKGGTKAIRSSPWPFFGGCRKPGWLGTAESEPLWPFQTGLAQASRLKLPMITRMQWGFPPTFCYISNSCTD